MNVMSLRLNVSERKHILKWAKQAKKDKSEAARQLLEYGWKFALLENYRQKKISLGRLAQELDISVPEAMDFLAQHGVQAHLDYGDYLESLEFLDNAAKG